LGTTDKQFNLHLRMLLRNLDEAKQQVTKEDTDEKIEILIQDLQKALED